MNSSSKRIKYENFSFNSVLPDDLNSDSVPFQEVYFDTIIDPKQISKIISELNKILPLSNLTHLKRVRNKDILLGIIENDLILNVIKNSTIKEYLKGDIRKVLVAKIPPKTRKQFENMTKFWPCNFHPNLYLEKLCTNTLFTIKDLESHSLYMRIVMDISKHFGGVNSGLVVDPKTDKIISIGYQSNVPLRHAPMVLIDGVARNQKGGCWEVFEEYEEIMNILINKYSDSEFVQGTISDNKEYYLCTNFFVYLYKEPCIMCSMALVHSRVKRVFFMEKSSNGGLESLCKLHTVKSLNHHFEVFAVCNKISYS